MNNDSRLAMEKRNFFAVDEFCAMLDGLISVPLVYKQIASGDIPVITVGRRKLIPAWYVNGLLRSNNEQRQ